MWTNVTLQLRPWFQGRNHAVDPLEVGEVGKIDYQTAWTFPQLDLDACLQP